MKLTRYYVLMSMVPMACLFTSGKKVLFVVNNE